MIRSHKVCGFRGQGCSSSLAKLVDRVNPAIPLLCKVTEWRIVTQMVRQLLENCWTTGTKIILTGHFPEKVSSNRKYARDKEEQSD